MPPMPRAWMNWRGAAGFVDYKSFAAPDGETVTISVWESAEAAGAGAARANIWPRRAAGGATIMPNTMYVCEEAAVRRFP
jgi:heme-degrading monooxygenase HmoA